MEGFTGGSQLYELFLSCGCGFLLGAYYDVFRLLRVMLPCRRWTVFVQDVVFFVTAAVITFLFDLTLTGGLLRFYLFVGLAAGFLAYRFTLGRLVMTCAATVLRAIAACDGCGGWFAGRLRCCAVFCSARLGGCGKKLRKLQKKLLFF